MKLAVLGTGMVGRAIAAKLASQGHEVALGTRDPDASRARPTPPKVLNLDDWLAANPAISLMRIGEASRFGEMIFAALNANATVEALSAAAEMIGDKILIDITNPLDYSKGLPPRLFVINTDSLAEAIQRALPEARVVKTLNTVNANIMVEPGLVPGGEHTMFVAGNDEAARTRVADLLRTELGWTDIIDLGDLTGARGMEAALHLWLRVWDRLGTPKFGIKVVR